MNQALQIFERVGAHSIPLGEHTIPLGEHTIPSRQINVDLTQDDDENSASGSQESSLVARRYPAFYPEYFFVFADNEKRMAPAGSSRVGGGRNRQLIRRRQDIDEVGLRPLSLPILRHNNSNIETLGQVREQVQPSVDGSNELRIAEQIPCPSPRPSSTTIDLTVDEEGDDQTGDSGPSSIPGILETKEDLSANRTDMSFPYSRANNNGAMIQEGELVEILDPNNPVRDIIEIPDESPIQRKTRARKKNDAQDTKKHIKRQRAVSSSSAGKNASEIPSANDPEIENTKVISVLKGKLTCSICQQTVAESKSPLASTVCGHLFCQRCIRKAVRLTNSCPTCRKKIKLRDVHRVYF